MRTFKLAAILFISFLVPLTCLAETESTHNKQTLIFGLLPYINTHKLIETFLPLKNYLEKELNRPIKLVTAPSYKEYLQRSLDGKYDIYHSAPHFAVLAELDYGHRRLSRYARLLDGSILIVKNGPVKSIKDLKGKTMITPPRLSLVSMLGEVFVKDNNLLPGKDITIRQTSSHTNAILSVAKGKTEAAVVASGIFEGMSKDVKSKLTILAKTRQVPHVMFTANSKLPEEVYLAVKTAMLNFTAEGPGKVFFEKTKRINMTNTTDDDINALRPYVDILRTLIK